MHIVPLHLMLTVTQIYTIFVTLLSKATHYKAACMSGKAASF